jgi:hypothetical protein
VNIQTFRTSSLLTGLLLAATSAHAQTAPPQIPGPGPSNLLAPTRSPLGYSRTAPASAQYAQQYVVISEPKWGTGFGVEGFAGRLQFTNAYQRYDQDLAGGLAGLYLGQSLRFRGFYWHGTSSKDSLPDQIESFGGEVQMGLYSHWFIHPFVLGGGGRINYLDGYVDKAGGTPEAETTWIGGAGIQIRPLDWLDLNVTWRDYLLKSPVRDTWLSNSLWTAGLSIRFGGTPKKQQAPTAYGPGGTVVAAGAAGAAAGNTATFPIPAGGGEIRVIYNGDSLTVRDSAGTVRTLATGIATNEAVKSVVSSELAYLNALYPLEGGLGAARGPYTPEQADTLARRMGFRTNEIVDYALQTQAEGIRAGLKAEMAARGVDDKTQAAVLARVDSTLNERLRLNAADSRMIRMRDDSAYARRAREEAEADRRTVSVSTGGFSQWYFDGRVSFRSPWSRQLRLVPEAALGFLGGGVSALVAGNAQYVFTKEGDVKPYVGLGLGLLVRGDEIDGETGTSFVVNPAFGIEYRTRAAQALGNRATAFFFEAQGVDLFRNFRLLGGVTWKF